MRQIPSLLIFLLVGSSSFSQQFLTGIVRKKDTRDSLSSVSVYNRTLKKHTLSSEDGKYSIMAQTNDTVIFSAVGFQSDSLIVTGKMLGTAEVPVFLKLRDGSLQAVTVGESSNYQQDSLERRQVFAWIYDQEGQPIVEKQRQGDGVGVELNVIQHPQSEVRQRLQLKKRIMKEEEKHYVNYRWSIDYVGKLTHLQGDSLKTFMVKYRPSYDWCRKAANVDMLVYINDNYKTFAKKN